MTLSIVRLPVDDKGGPTASLGQAGQIHTPTDACEGRTDALRDGGMTLPDVSGSSIDDDGCLIGWHWGQAAVEINLALRCLLTKLTTIIPLTPNYDKGIIELKQQSLTAITVQSLYFSIRHNVVAIELEQYVSFRSVRPDRFYSHRGLGLKSYESGANINGDQTRLHPSSPYLSRSVYR